ncbi:MAG: sigma-E factor negative regulatory protein [Methylococcaceae bacterium]|jgi:sigma-E factor negative regulatory protein RseA
MHDELKQKISVLLDNELPSKDALELLEQICAQPGLQKQMERYQAIGSVLKKEPIILPDIDFSARIREQLEHEPNYLLRQTKPKLFKQHYKWMALAASIAFLAVLALPNRLLVENNPTGSLPLADAQKVIDPIQPENPQSGRDHANQRFNDYLQAHDNSVYTNGEAHFQPYARVATFERE